MGGASRFRHRTHSSRTTRDFAALGAKMRFSRAYSLDRSVRRLTSCSSCSGTIISSMVASLWGQRKNPGSDRHRPSAMRSNTSLIPGLVLSSRCATSQVSILICSNSRNGFSSSG